jgi:hypothetical protein
LEEEEALLEVEEEEEVLLDCLHVEELTVGSTSYEVEGEEAVITDEVVVVVAVEVEEE